MDAIDCKGQIPAPFDGENVAYLAGPMRGLKLFAFDRFDHGRGLLESAGWEVVSPADMDRSAGLHPERLPDDWDWNELPSDFDLEEAFCNDIRAIEQVANAVFFLPGSEDSRGAWFEMCVAMVHEVPRYKNWIHGE